MTKRQLIKSILGIYNVWQYKYGVSRCKLFGITIKKRWNFDSYYPQDRSFWKND